MGGSPETAFGIYSRLLKRHSHHRNNYSDKLSHQIFDNMEIENFTIYSSIGEAKQRCEWQIFEWVVP
jgi:hypothetical protein